MGPLQYSVCCAPAQGAADPCRRWRRRRCLLKGCERSFRPTRPQSHYCSGECRRLAEVWRRRRASRSWRASEQGKARRREQSRRYRRRIPLVVLSETPISQSEAYPEPAAREGQRPATILEESLVRMCARPGCYVLFKVSWVCSRQRFCCGLCRQALRNVLDREARYGRRRQKGIRPQRRRAKPCPKPRL